MKTTGEKLPVKTVDDYMASVPEPARITLEKLRQLIRDTAPMAEEVISYGIPAFKYEGMLVGFGAARNHCGFYVMSPATMIAFQKELEGYDTATATVRFPADKPLPAALIKKLVKARVKENEALTAAKKKKKK
jgi:uncharacterized protein YdhG (YjbR/CyaY superfamily)